MLPRKYLIRGTLGTGAVLSTWPCVGRWGTQCRRAWISNSERTGDLPPSESPMVIMIMHPSGYGSIPINTIFCGMNIHLPAILMFTRGTRSWHTAICLIKCQNARDLSECMSDKMSDRMPDRLSDRMSVGDHSKKVIHFCIFSCQGSGLSWKGQGSNMTLWAKDNESRDRNIEQEIETTLHVDGDVSEIHVSRYK